MPISSCFHIDVKKVHIAHEFTLDRVCKCEYPRGRGTYGLVCVLEGAAEYRFFTGERVRVTKGDFLFIFPDSAYSIVTQKAFRHYTVNFDIHEDTSLLEVLKTPCALLQEKNTEQLERSFKKLVSIWRLKKSGYEMQTIGVLYELLSLFYFDYIQPQDGMTDQRLLIAKEYVERHFDQTITLERLAYLSNMSITNFRREWARRYAEAPMQYRDSLRVYYAKEYLNSGYYNVSEIAEKCGFEDVSYFVRFFKKKTGITPGQYKKMI